MISLLRPLRGKSLTLLMLILLCVLAGCDNPFQPAAAATPSHSKIRLVVGGKLDVEAHLLTEMYVLLLQHAGFDVVDKALLGGNDVVFNAITSGKIDLYPEFTATGLARLGVSPTGDPGQNDQNVKSGYEQKYHITWLDVAPLNDTYGLCTSKSIASELKIATISDLIPLVPQLTIATPPDGLNDPSALPGLKPTYGITFGQSRTINTDEEGTFQRVIDGQAQLNVCYTTSPLIAQNNFVLLKDDKNSFPVYNPAPIVRDDTLRKAPQIATVLNQLAPRLTNDVSIMLQAEVAAGFSPTNVAKAWLQSQGLL